MKTVEQSASAFEHFTLTCLQVEKFECIFEMISHKARRKLGNYKVLFPVPHHDEISIRNSFRHITRT